MFFHSIKNIKQLELFRKWLTITRKKYGYVREKEGASIVAPCPGGPTFQLRPVLDAQFLGQNSLRLLLTKINHLVFN